MIYLFYGTDTEKAREKAHALMDALVAKKPDALVFKLDAETWSRSEMEGLLGSEGLFQKSNIVFLNRVLENEEAEEYVLGALAELEASPNMFIVLEGGLTKAVIGKFEKKASKVQEFATAAKAKKEFNAFAMADALGNRDKKNLWSLYEEALFEGKPVEEIHGLLFWQLKSMLQAKNSGSAEDAGLKPFVYSKSLRFARNFKEGELERLSSDFVRAYHDSRRGLVDFETELERVILTV